MLSGPSRNNMTFSAPALNLNGAPYATATDAIPSFPYRFMHVLAKLKGNQGAWGQGELTLQQSVDGITWSDLDTPTTISESSYVRDVAIPDAACVRALLTAPSEIPALVSLDFHFYGLPEESTYWH